MVHAHRMLHTEGYKYTQLRLCNTHCFPTATMVARTCLNVTSYVHYLSCLNTNLLCVSLIIGTENKKIVRTICCATVFLAPVHFINKKVYSWKLIFVAWSIMSCTGWSKSLCVPDICIVIIRCSETFWSPCTSGSGSPPPSTNTLLCVNCIVQNVK